MAPLLVLRRCRACTVCLVECPFGMRVPLPSLGGIHRTARVMIFTVVIARGAGTRNYIGRLARALSETAIIIELEKDA